MATFDERSQLYCIALATWHNGYDSCARAQGLCTFIAGPRHPRGAFWPSGKAFALLQLAKQLDICRIKPQEAWPSGDARIAKELHAVRASEAKPTQIQQQDPQRIFCANPLHAYSSSAVVGSATFLFGDQLLRLHAVYCMAKQQAFLQRAAFQAESLARASSTDATELICRMC